jgi:saccharopine dehydrogenase-like NADP-dependent oxidoreductase
MRVLVLGVGRVGSLIVRELSRSFEVTAVDLDRRRLEALGREVATLSMDVSNEDKLVEAMRGHELVVNALPGSLGFRVLRACVRGRRDLVDVSFMPEDPLTMKEAVLDAGITAIVDAGFAPGLSNMLVGRSLADLGNLDSVEINVGGLPKVPRPPLYHMVLFSPMDLIDEYLRPARAVKGGRLVYLDPLSVVERVRVLGFELERFPTDGLRTMLSTVNAYDMVEYTLRWPGHLERMRVLKELGFFSRDRLESTVQAIAPHMTYEGVDMSLMEVITRSANVEVRYLLYDEAVGGDMSMARVTGYTATYVTHLLAEGKIEKGLIPPEHLGAKRDAFDYIVGNLRSRGIKIERIASS